MPKMKTSRGTAKRFKFSKGGKVKHKKAYTRHHAWAKNRKQKRHLRQANVLNKTEGEVIRRMMPYR